MTEGPRAFVQEADCAERVVVLEVRVPGRTSLVIVGATKKGGIAGLVPRELRRALWGARLPPGSARQRPREDALAGASVLALGEAEVFVQQHDAARVIRAQGGRVVVTDAPTPKDLVAFVDATDEQRAAWEARGAELARTLAEEAIDVRRPEVVKILERAKTRIDRRRDAIRADLDKITQADKIAAQAQWLVAEAARAPRGATRLVVTDWSTGEAVPMDVPLDPSRSAREQVEAMFKRAKRLRLGARVAEERLRQAEQQRAAVVAALDLVHRAESVAAIEDAAREAKRAAPRDVALVSSEPGKPRAKKEGGARRTPFRTFVARSGRKIFVGKGAADNDALTQAAKPHHLWLHAKDRTGAHVIVPLDKGQTCPAEDLVDAAHLAAHFSDAREEKIVDVQYTQKRHLRKPKGSAPGFVVVDREKVLALRMDAEILPALLEREEV
jgi:predicted ribosome quality control (RQC) complex YloA/Tae2 family protein